jgi:hypothetical protein
VETRCIYIQGGAKKWIFLSFGDENSKNDPTRDNFMRESIARIPEKIYKSTFLHHLVYETKIASGKTLSKLNIFDYFAPFLFTPQQILFRLSDFDHFSQNISNEFLVFKIKWY